jgi:hypothetical protein
MYKTITALASSLIASSAIAYIPTALMVYAGISGDARADINHTVSQLAASKPALAFDQVFLRVLNTAATAHNNSAAYRISSIGLSTPKGVNRCSQRSNWQNTSKPALISYGGLYSQCFIDSYSGHTPAQLTYQPVGMIYGNSSLDPVPNINKIRSTLALNMPAQSSDFLSTQLPIYQYYPLLALDYEVNDFITQAQVNSLTATIQTLGTAYGNYPGRPVIAYINPTYWWQANKKHPVDLQALSQAIAHKKGGYLLVGAYEGVADNKLNSTLNLLELNQIPFRVGVGITGDTLTPSCSSIASWKKYSQFKGVALYQFTNSQPKQSTLNAAAQCLSDL